MAPNARIAFVRINIAHHVNDMDILLLHGSYMQICDWDSRMRSSRYLYVYWRNGWSVRYHNATRVAVSYDHGPDLILPRARQSDIYGYGSFSVYAPCLEFADVSDFGATVFIAPRLQL